MVERTEGAGSTVSRRATPMDSIVKYAAGSSASARVAGAGTVDEEKSRGEK